LAEITQVISPEHGYVFHNRLTHSLKVAQIARRIAQRTLKENDADENLTMDLPDVVEAAALAHDLGHPPFGHAAEVELNKLVQDAGLRDGFEGNAQSFRIITRLAASDSLTLKNHGEEDEHEESVPGLNWTRQCLNSVLKYPWGFAKNSTYPKKWGFYDSEKEIFDWVRKDQPKLRRCLGAEIIDWADDITYAVHDLLDFFRSGNIPIDRMRQGEGEYFEFISGVFARKPDWEPLSAECHKILERLIENFPFNPGRRFTDTDQDHMRLNQFATGLIRPLVEAITYAPNASLSQPIAQIDPDARRQVDLLKQFTWHYIILKRHLALRQAGQRKAIRTVFRKLLLAARKGDLHLFPDATIERLKRSDLEHTMYVAMGLRDESANIAKNETVRHVADYIAGMTEKELMRVYRTLEGAV
jgi:dGTPase